MDRSLEQRTSAKEVVRDFAGREIVKVCCTHLPKPVMMGKLFPLPFDFYRASVMDYFPGSEKQKRDAFDKAYSVSPGYCSQACYNGWLETMGGQL